MKPSWREAKECMLSSWDAHAGCGSHAWLTWEKPKMFKLSSKIPPVAHVPCLVINLFDTAAACRKYKGGSAQCDSVADQSVMLACTKGTLVEKSKSASKHCVLSSTSAAFYLLWKADPEQNCFTSKGWDSNLKWIIKIKKRKDKNRLDFKWSKGMMWGTGVRIACIVGRLSGSSVCMQGLILLDFGCVLWVNNWQTRKCLSFISAHSHG